MLNSDSNLPNKVSSDFNLESTVLHYGEDQEFVSSEDLLEESQDVQQEVIVVDKKPKKPVRKIGIFGGTFDPIHRGHIECALAAFRTCELDEILFVVANQPVYKKDRYVSPARERFDAVSEALEEYENFSPSDIEIKRGGDSYSVETVKELRKEYARLHSKEKNVFYLIVGADTAKYLPEWKDAKKLSKICHIVVVARGSRPVGSKLKKRIKKAFKKVHFVKADTTPLSSTQVRLLMEEGSDISLLLPSAVESTLSGRISMTPERDPLTEEYLEELRVELKTRVNEKRYLHSLSVAKMAEELAYVYDVDERKAYLAGILHDWDKGLSDIELKEHAKILKVDFFLGEVVVNEMPAILHGYTAAGSLAQSRPEIPGDVLQAVERHTTAAVGMSALDKVIYIADILEPQRTFLDVDDLRAAIGKISLDELFFKSLGRVIQVLLRDERSLYPDSIKVWNYYCKKMRGR